jgi:predicted XRE-type DNA-binding protein
MELTSFLFSVIIVPTMRTTLAIDDDILEQVKEYAEQRNLSMSKAASDLIRRGISRPAPTHMENGLRVFSRSADSPLITTELIRTLESEQDLDKNR